MDKPPTTTSGSSTPTRLKRITRGDLPFVQQSPSNSDDGGSPASRMPAADLQPRASMDRIMQKVRPRRSLGRSGRPGSFMDSVRGFIGGSEGFDPGLRRAASVATSISTSAELLTEIAGESVLLHGDVQVASGFFKSRTQYIVLTKSHLIRFRNQDRALDVFPAISAGTKASGTRHTRFSSVDSATEAQGIGEGAQVVPWTQVVAVHTLNEGKPVYSVEITQLDEDRMQPSSLVLHYKNAVDLDKWTRTMHEAVVDERRRNALPLGTEIVAHAARLLELEADYDPNHFRIFCAVQRAVKPSFRASSDDLAKNLSIVCIVAFGRYKLHLLPIPRSVRNGSSSSSLADLQAKSFGFAALENVAQIENDSFQLSFRIPFQSTQVISLATFGASEILDCLKAATSLLGAAPHVGPHGSREVPAFASILVAYCVAYGLDPEGVQYHESTEDPPTLILYPSTYGRSYSTLEAVAILRALQRYRRFGTISFRDIDLSELLSAHDPYQVSLAEGESLDFSGAQEFETLVMSNDRLSRLDLSGCFCRASADVQRSVFSALLPLCESPMVRLDWITLTGNPLGECDIDHLFSALSQPLCRFRALEIGQCHLEERNLLNLLSASANQSNTIESIDISCNGGRILPQSLRRELRAYRRLRKLNLSHLSAPTECQDALLDADLLSRWPLEELRLSHCRLNSASGAALASYLRAPQSSNLRLLDISSCHLTGLDIARLFESLATQPNQRRDIDIQISGNAIEEGHENLVTAITRDQCPSHLTMRGLEYRSEEAFERLLEALARNTTITYLDISGVSLPGDAQDTTCQALGRLLTLNTCLSYFDLSGERTHLMASALGMGLQQSFQNLSKNCCLEVLRLQHQGLGSQGIQTLASSIKQNEKLKELHIDDNDIDLQALRSIVRAVEANKTLLFVSSLNPDRTRAESRLIRAFDSMQDSTLQQQAPNPARYASNLVSSAKSTEVMRRIGRSFSGSQNGMIGPARKQGSSRSSSKGVSSRATFAPELQLIVDQFNFEWAREMARLQQHLSRNIAVINQPDSESKPVGSTRKHDSLGSLEAALRAVDYADAPPAMDFLAMCPTPHVDSDEEHDTPLEIRISATKKADD